MKPETLKRIAEKVGYGQISEYRGVLVVGRGEPSIHQELKEYDPLNNPAQLLECIKVLLDEGWEITKDSIQGYCLMYDEKGDGEYDDCLTSKSFEQCVMDAMEKLIDE